MPIYEYECETCGRVHEILQKISDNPVSKCPNCSGSLHKRISQCTFHLKGTGWYATDYANRSGTSSTSGKKENSDSKESTSKESTADTQSKTSSNGGGDS
ncbi:MAG: zinc ribbon domain-containing protein [Desulfobacterales bacterium]|nr:zinc ribbon domain-containing protein [Desulfobacterales bacterium]